MALLGKKQLLTHLQIAVLVKDGFKIIKIATDFDNVKLFTSPVTNTLTFDIAA